MPASANDISERYLKKAIAEMNELGHEIAEAAGSERAPVLGSGHPLAEIFLLKHRPQIAEIHEGVAFFGRAGQAILKSLQRLRVDPTAVYGTNCLKYEGEEEEEALRFLLRELHVVQPKVVVVMGQDALACLNAVQFPLATEVEARPGEIQRFTPTVEALVCPDIDAALDEQPAKRSFWNAFKAVGPWWSELPPY
ncbi:MAG: uracil-DNA glycosylase [Thermoleophilia bacterium]|nr:uracil-DNA glycosylase [Thermoleophilia bacterium]MDQ3858921.1 uracil-DNA glycosylase [Actinomycetota bacterium]